MKSKVIIEIPEGSKEKIEINKEGVAVVDRMLSIPVPTAYGFIPDTLAEDGDALDIFILSNKYLDTYDEVEVNLVGMFECLDQGVADNKLVGTIASEDFSEVEIFKYLVQIGDYLLNYKPGFEVKDYSSIVTKTFMKRYKV